MIQCYEIILCVLGSSYVFSVSDWTQPFFSGNSKSAFNSGERSQPDASGVCW